jgi:hypothetical protein
MSDQQRDPILAELTTLKSARSTWDAHWRDILLHVLPRHGRWTSSDRNDGRKRHGSIIDDTATLAVRSAVAGLMAHGSSPARPWFAWGTDDPELDRHRPVQEWTHLVRDLMLRRLRRSGAYRMLGSGYEATLTTGTFCAIQVPTYDERSVHHFVSPVGEYCLAANQWGRIDTAIRELTWTVAQVVEEFGLESVTPQTRRAYEQGLYHQQVELLHAVRPRRGSYDGAKRDSSNMPIQSLWYERGADCGTYLRDGGFRDNPLICPRWNVLDGDVYGSSPCMDALGDIRALQHAHKKLAEAINYHVRPAMKAPTSAKNREIDGEPGGTTFVDAGGDNSYGPAWQTTLDLAAMERVIGAHQHRINRALYYEQFQYLASLNASTQRTAAEILERRDESFVILGPVVERYEDELFRPMLDLLFTRMLEAGDIPTPPKELHGRPLALDFLSPLSQAQRAIATNGVERWTRFIGALATVRPEAADKLDVDELSDAYGQYLGVDPRLIAASEQVAFVRKARNESLAAQQQSTMAVEQAGAARDLAQAQPAGNPPQDLSEAWSGYDSPSLRSLLS